MELIPGEAFQPPAIRAKQDDDFDNPAFTFAQGAEALWSVPDGAAGKSCASCHGQGGAITIRHAAASYPKYSTEAAAVITLEGRINLCRKDKLQAGPWSEGSNALLAMTAFLRSLSRGLPSTVDISGPSAPVFERGQTLFEKKLGRLQLSCAQCHDRNYGHNFGARLLSQGQPLAYPVFLDSEKRMISLHQRFRMCNALARADPEPEGSPDYVALELYLDWRSKNLPITAPGVRP